MTRAHGTKRTGRPRKLIKQEVVKVVVEARPRWGPRFEWAGFLSEWLLRKLSSPRRSRSSLSSAPLLSSRAPKKVLLLRAHIPLNEEEET